MKIERHSDFSVLVTFPSCRMASEFERGLSSPAESDREAVRNAALEEVELPWNIVFSIAYLDGVMKGEMQEIRGHWKRVSDYLKSQPVQPSDTEMLDWLVNGPYHFYEYKEGWKLCKFRTSDTYDWDGMYYTSQREAIKAAMRAEREGS